jgi:16S rRNA (cytidine1402-2'-O)-methyltransferase
MTKQFETVIRGSVSQVRNEVDRNPDQRKGEFVLVLAGSEKDEQDGFAGALKLARALQSHLSASQAARVAAKLHDVSRRDLYAALESAD